MLQGAGFDVPEDAFSTQPDRPGRLADGDGGPGNAAWQKAQRLALQANARSRRN